MNKITQEQREIDSIERKTSDLRIQVKSLHSKIKILVERKKEIRRGISARSRAERHRERMDKGIARRATPAWAYAIMSILKEYCEGLTPYEMRTQYFMGSPAVSGNSLRRVWIEADPDSYERLGGDLRKLAAEGPKEWMKPAPTPSNRDGKEQIHDIQ